VTPSLTLAVIGHVNHGKTALVRALTGTETDRLKEEVERGLSITLGFASRTYKTGIVDLIDAPGHEDFIRAMVSGATGVRAVLLVVSATEGFGRQTLEHLRISQMLGVRAGMVVVTKSDLIASGQAPKILESVRATLRDTFLALEPVIFCSALTGLGLQDVDLSLEDLVARAPPADPLPGAFLPIDRRFSVTGTGTVVTGTLQGGSLTADMPMVLEPSGRRVSIRQLQAHGRTTERAQSGGRVAVGLRGASPDEIQIGDVLCSPECYHASLQVDVEVSVSIESPRQLKHLDQVRVMWGTRQDMGSLRLLGTTGIDPGERGLAQIRFSTPVIAFTGQRALLRRPSPAATLGGAVVLDAEAAPWRGRAPQRQVILQAALSRDLSQIAASLAARDGGLVAVSDLIRLARLSLSEVYVQLEPTFATFDSDHLVVRTAMADARSQYLRRLVAAHHMAPLKVDFPANAIRNAMAPEVSRDLIGHAERDLADNKEIRLNGPQVALFNHNPLTNLPTATLERLELIETRLRDSGLVPQDTRLLGGDETNALELVQLLVDLGRAVSLRNHALRQTLVFHADALSAAAAQLLTAFPHPLAFTTGEARAALATTRKYIVPVLEYLDTQGLTAREGDIRRVTPQFKRR